MRIGRYWVASLRNTDFADICYCIKSWDYLGNVNFQTRSPKIGGYGGAEHPRTPLFSEVLAKFTLSNYSARRGIYRKKGLRRPFFRDHWLE